MMTFRAKKPPHCLTDNALLEWGNCSLTVADLESGVAGADLLREMGGGRMQLDGRRMYAAAIAWWVPSGGGEGSVAHRGRTHSSRRGMRFQSSQRLNHMVSRSVRRSHAFVCTPTKINSRRATPPFRSVGGVEGSVPPPAGAAVDVRRRRAARCAA